MNCSKPAKILALALLTAGAVASTQDAVTLQRALVANSTETYKTTMTMKQSFELPGGSGTQEMDVNVGATYILTFGAVDEEKGTAEVTFTTRDLDVKMEGPMAGMMPQDQLPREMVQKGTMSRRGALTLQAAPQSGAMAMMSSMVQPTQTGLFAELPEKPVRIGDTWTITLPKSPTFGNTEQTLTATLKGERAVDGRSAWVIGVTGTVNMNMNMANAPADQNPMGMNMVIKGTLAMSSEALVDKQTGQTLLMTSKVDSNQTVELADMGMNLPIKGTMSVRIEKQK